MALTRSRVGVPCAHAPAPVCRLRVNGYRYCRLGLYHPIDHRRKRESDQSAVCRHRWIRDPRLRPQYVPEESYSSQEPPKNCHIRRSRDRATCARHFVDRQSRPRLQSSDGHDVRGHRRLRHRFHTRGLESNQVQRFMK